MAVTLTGLRCLVEIADASLNVSTAAAAMHLSQPCVSRHLKQVEEALGFKVFARQGRQLVAITPAGERAVEAARRVMGEVDGLRRYAANTRGETAGDLSIVSPQAYALHVLPPLLGELLSRYPDLSIRMQSLGEGEKVRPAEHDRCDLLLNSTAGADVPEGLAVPLFRWRRVAVVPREHALASSQGPVPLEELARWPLVTYETSRQASSTLSRTLAACGLQPRFSCSAHDTDTLKAYVGVGLGVGLVAELAISPADRRAFAILQVDPALPDCTAWAVLPQGRVLRNPTLDLLRLLAPQLDPGALRRAAEGMPPPRWPEPPDFRPA